MDLTEKSGFVGGRRAPVRLIVALIAMAGVTLVIACGLGSANLSPQTVLRAFWEAISGRESSNPTASAILMNIRLPRALLAYCVGGALAVSGAGVQGVFQNPMADPYLLGISSGASLGAAAAILFRWQIAWLGLGAVALSAFVGAGIALALVISLAGFRSGTVNLLLSGVAVSAFLSALLSGLLAWQHQAAETVYLWMMGSVASASWQKLAVCAPVALIGAAALRYFARDLNALLTGEAQARSLGVSAGKVRLAVILLCAAVTASAVSMCGMIGFVGLIVPHAIRLIAGPDHRGLIPASLLAGGWYLLAMDTLARTVVAPTEIPVGVLTALIGGPFFLILLRRNRRARR